MHLHELAAACVSLAQAAGREILEVYSSPAIAKQDKADASPLTEADVRAHRVIVEGLNRLEPKLPVLSEESSAVPWVERAGWQRYWLVDPLDGTKEFLSRNGEFTVNIALIEASRPVLGVVHVPVTNVTYWGMPTAPHGPEASRIDANGVISRITVAVATARTTRVLGSRSHLGNSLDGFLRRLGDYQLVQAGSALKFCVLAEGGADVYPRLGPTSAWDTAAGQAVVEGAGGVVVTLDGAPLAYNTRESLLNPHFIAYADRARDWRGLLS